MRVAFRLYDEYSINAEPFISLYEAFKRYCDCNDNTIDAFLVKGNGDNKNEDCDIIIYANHAPSESVNAEKKEQYRIWYCSDGSVVPSKDFEDKIASYDAVIHGAVRTYELYYKKRGQDDSVEPLFLPFGGDAAKYYPSLDDNYISDLAFIFDSGRVYVGLDDILQRGAAGDMLIYGDDLPRELCRYAGIHRGAVNSDKKRAVFSSAEGVIILHDSRYKRWGLWDWDVFNVILCGGIPIVDRCYGLPDYLHNFMRVVDFVGDYVPIFYNELDEEDVEPVVKKRDSGRQYILTEHTADVRAKVLFDYIEYICGGWY